MRYARWAVAALCTYEAVAIFSHRLPTITALCRTRPWLAGIIVGGLAWHLAS